MDQKFETRFVQNPAEKPRALSPISHLLRHYKRDPLEELCNLRIASPLKDLDDLPNRTPCFGMLQHKSLETKTRNSNENP